MLNKREVLKLLTALARMNDLPVISSDSGLNDEICTPEDRESVRRMGNLIACLRQSFDYRDSPEFDDKVGGKSEAFKAMLERLVQDPAKRRGNQERFDKALVDVMSSDQILKLAAVANHPTIEEIRHLVRSLSNPD